MALRQHGRGHVTWSECTRKVTETLWKTQECLLDHTKQENLADAYKLDHSRYHDLPGRKWTAKAQCEVFLRDKDANVVTLHDICQVLQCKTPIKNEYFFAGPVLDGTHCALGKECRGEECVPVLEPPYIFKYCEEDNWSEWKEGTCQSSCLSKSKGAIVKRRFCKHGSYRTACCEGPYYGVVLCDDSKLCINNRKTFNQFTTAKCTMFSIAVEMYDKAYLMYKLEKGPGWQALHDVKKPWKACTIFCRRKNYTSTYYAPRSEMLDSAVDSYFPDGTWCHKKDGQDYYCRQHYCLPESYSIEE